jgi:integrase
MAFAMTLRRMGLEGVTAHGMRSAFRDWCAERTNFPHDVIEQCLAHATGSKTELAYKRTDHFEKRRELMESWARHCCEAPADNIVTLARVSGHEG